MPERLEPTRVIVGTMELTSPSPVNGTLVTIGWVYDKIGQQCNPDRLVHGEPVWDNTKLLVETEGAWYFGRPGIPGGRVATKEDRGVFIDVTDSVQGCERHWRTPKALGILTVGGVFAWGNSNSERITRILAASSHDLTLVRSTEPMLRLNQDRRFIYLNEQLSTLGISKTAWELGTKFIRSEVNK